MQRATQRTACVILVTAWAAGPASVHAQQTRVYFDTLDASGQLTGGDLLIDLADPAQRAEYGELPPYFRLTPWSVATVRDNGPSDNRIDLVLVGDGYSAGEMNKYALHVNNLLAAFFAQEPLAAYAGYFNVHRVDVVSADSGVDEADEGIFKNTALDMVYGCFGVTHGLCVNVAKATAAAASAPQVDQILALANSTRFGGVGYPSSNVGTVAGDNTAAVEIALHEFGHAFANLHDEYGYGASGPYTGVEFPQANVTIFPAAALTASNWKWFRWLDLENVDTFLGGATYASGVYRPTMDSKMRTLGRPFEEVNVEQFIREIYQVLSPVDDATPVSAEPFSPCNAEFFVERLEPLDHALDIVWKLNGLPILGQTGPTFRRTNQFLNPGLNTVSVTVTDNTPRMRDPSFRYTNMTFSRAWTILSTGTLGECDCTACADLNENGSIDLRDAAAFSRCFARQPFSEPLCVCADLNGDLKVDLADYRGFADYLGNPPADAHPACLEP